MLEVIGQVCLIVLRMASPMRRRARIEVTKFRNVCPDLHVVLMRFGQLILERTDVQTIESDRMRGRLLLQEQLEGRETCDLGSAGRFVLCRQGFLQDVRKRQVLPFFSQKILILGS